jgi:hypothetical protein
MPIVVTALNLQRMDGYCNLLLADSQEVADPDYSRDGSGVTIDHQVLHRPDLLAAWIVDFSVQVDAD